jgi:hypothetical protein
MFTTENHTLLQIPTLFGKETAEQNNLFPKSAENHLSAYKKGRDRSRPWHVAGRLRS